MLRNDISRWDDRPGLESRPKDIRESDVRGPDRVKVYAEIRGEVFMQIRPGSTALNAIDTQTPHAYTSGKRRTVFYHDVSLEVGQSSSVDYYS